MFGGDDRIREGRQETTAIATGAGLGIVGWSPGFTVERDNEVGLRPLFFLAMVCRVRLAGDHEHLADADMGDGTAGEFLPILDDSHFQPSPSSRRCRNHGRDTAAGHGATDPQPGSLPRVIRQPGFDRGITGGNVSGQFPRHSHEPLAGGAALHHLKVAGGRQGQFRGPERDGKPQGEGERCEKKWPNHGLWLQSRGPHASQRGGETRIPALPARFFTT